MKKKFISCYALLLVAVIYNATAVPAYLGLGITHPSVSVTNNYTDSSFGKINITEHNKGSGTGFNAKLLFMGEKKKCAMTLETNLNQLKLGDAEGFDGQLMLGLGPRIGNSRFKFVLSGLVGYGLDILKEEKDYSQDNIFIFTMLLGIDGLFMARVTDKVSCYISAAGLIGIGSVNDDGYVYINGDYYSGKVSGGSDLGYFMPKAGILIKL